MTVPPVPVCGIGASAGGIEALKQLFSELSPQLGLAYVIVVHLAPDRHSELPNIIASVTPMPVRQVGDHDKVKLAPDTVYVIAPGRMLQITDASVAAAPFETPHARRNAIDLFLRSLAAAHGDGFALVLSGSGSDGALGAKAVKESGGLVLVQDPSDAAYGDMPRAVIATGVADVVLPARALAVRLAELSRSKKRVRHVLQAAGNPAQMPETEEQALREVFALVWKRTGHDFSKYNRATVLRRLSRRMQLCERSTIVDYVRHLDGDGEEVRALLGDLLISVTTFFRDPEAWAALRTRVVGPLVEQTDGREQIRAWVPGCATGEEAYSLAFLLHEEFEKRALRPNFVVFASDVDEEAIGTAREGVYPRAIGTDVSEGQLERYFRAEEDYYRVESKIRDHVVFAVHSILRDPPFSRQHLVSCRNVLIYLEPDLQQQVMAVFRYACRDHAFLFLGASEMATDDLFRALDAKHRIFVTTESANGRTALPDILAAARPSPTKTRESGLPSQQSPGLVHLEALEAASPPSVLVDERWNVLHLSASAARFLQQAGGTPARRLTDWVRPELRDELHMLLDRAFDEPTPQRSRFIAVTFNGAKHDVAMVAQRHLTSRDQQTYVLVTFMDAGIASPDTTLSDHPPSDEFVRHLQDRLRQAEGRIERMREDHFLTQEDLRAANEELQSVHEEYRATTEELETSKEELQSINEELQTVNHALAIKLEEVSRAHADLENFVAAANVPMLFLDRELHVRRFTPRLGDLFSIRSRDIDRPVSELANTLEQPSLTEMARQVLDQSEPGVIERDVRTATGQTFIMRVGPYHTVPRQPADGVVVTFIDVTAIKEVEASLRQSEQQLEYELNFVRRLHRMTLDVATAPSFQEALGHVLRAAIALHGADSGHVQLFDAATATLRVAAQQAFAPSFLGRLESLDERNTSSYGRALRQRTVVQIPDILADADYTADREAAAVAGYRAVQSMPLLARNGQTVGVLSVHFRDPRVFSERDRQIGDVLAHETAQLIAFRAETEERQRAEVALRTSEARYRALFESIDEGYCTIEVLFDTAGVSRDYRFLETNPAFARQTGLINVIGRTMRELVPNHEDFWFEVYGHIALTGESKRFEHPAAGLSRFYDVYAFRIGEPERRQVAVLFNDITERKRRESNLAFLNDVSESLAYVTDANETLKTVSVKLAEHFRVQQCTLCELSGESQTLTTAAGEWHPDDACQIKATPPLSDLLSQEGQAVLTTGAPLVVGDTWSDSRINTEHDGTLGIRALVIVPLLRDGVCRFQMSMLDVKPRQWPDADIDLIRELTVRVWTRLQHARAEEALRQTHADLEQRVRDRTTDLAAANSALQTEVRERRAAEERIKELVGRLLAAQEEERRRIARDMHDQLGQPMTALRMGLESASVAGDLAATKEQIARTQRLAEEVDESIDFITWDLRPAALDHVGAVGALANLVNGWSQRFGIHAEFDARWPEGLRLAPEVEGNLYRLLQEALHNILKHAHASRVSVMFEQRAGEALLIIEDDGRGFDVQAELARSEGGAGLGLLSMRERARMVGGVFTIESSPGAGTSLYVRVPLEGAAP